MSNRFPAHRPGHRLSVPCLAALLFLAAARVEAATADSSRIYWLDLRSNGAVMTAAADGSNPKALITGQGLKGPDGVAVDAPHGKIYWTNMNEGTDQGSLQRADLDGSHVEYVIKPGGAHTPKQLQIDPVHGRLYWCNRDGFTLARSRLDGTEPEILVTGLQNPVGMALDVGKGLFYFSDKNAQTIQRASMDGAPGSLTGRKDIEILFSGLTRPIDLALDLGQGKIYWTDRDEGTVHRAPIGIPAGKTAADRGDIETLARGLNTPIGMALDLKAGKMYWTEGGNGAVGRANLDGSGKEILVPGRTGSFGTGITLVAVGENVTAMAPPRNARDYLTGGGPGRITARPSWDALGLPLRAAAPRILFSK
ncbi:MAG: 3-hydroxyacyl-CoA dehydrogenase [Fibrobacteres bacterium]|nr:3-hydroxyacyl-CoA dehydrogenase [Fibrobacterota bacterium]